MAAAVSGGCVLLLVLPTLSMAAAFGAPFAGTAMVRDVPGSLGCGASAGPTVTPQFSKVAGRFLTAANASLVPCGTKATAAADWYAYAELDSRRFTANHAISHESVNWTRSYAVRLHVVDPTNATQAVSDIGLSMLVCDRSNTTCDYANTATTSGAAFALAYATAGGGHVNRSVTGRSVELWDPFALPKGAGFNIVLEIYARLRIQTGDVAGTTASAHVDLASHGCGVRRDSLGLR